MSALNLVKSFVVLGVVVAIGFVIASPAIFMLGFGVPGNCTPPNSYCYQWGSLIALAVSPLYIGFIGIFFILFQRLRKHLKYIYILILLLPLSATTVAIGMINTTTKTPEPPREISQNKPVLEKKENQ